MLNLIKAYNDEQGNLKTVLGWLICRKIEKDCPQLLVAVIEPKEGETPFELAERYGISRIRAKRIIDASS